MNRFEHHASPSLQRLLGRGPIIACLLSYIPRLWLERLRIIYIIAQSKRWSLVGGDTCCVPNDAKLNVCAKLARKRLHIISKYA